ncbi:DUF721 domain-containing protein [Candidatus Endowatersipora endosymbiont of Watersipora subatra]|uniref:DUF721 domain-containing protein n=1 Tax=Candidatus Endowatersipora endosymbiont of Watersipora subatra TaxID=3077946 RepID=UPI00312C79A2
MRTPQPLSSFVVKILNPITEKRAGLSIDLIANWPEIVGEEHSQNSNPKRIVWFKEYDSKDKDFTPGTLELACKPQYSLFLQHCTKVILRRINTYFGFSAIARIKLDQMSWPYEGFEPQTQTPRTSILTAKKARILKKMIVSVEDETLRRALKKMGEGVLRNENNWNVESEMLIPPSL